MTKSELIQILSFGREHACCVDLQHVPAAPGYVRTTTILEDLRVSIEFDVWGMDEAGLYYWGKFENIDHLISCLEEYLSRPIEQWRALGPYDYLPRSPETGTAESHRLFKEFLASGQALVPTSGNFKTNSIAWLPLLKAT